MYQDFAVQCTWEGDNTILALQAGRSLVSSWESASRGKPLPPGVSYLASPETLTNNSNSKLDLEDIDRGWACVAANAVKKAAADYARELGKGLSKDEAMERCSQSRFIAAKLHTIGYVSCACHSAQFSTLLIDYLPDLPHDQASSRDIRLRSRERCSCTECQVVRLVASRGARRVVPQV